jgi:hypothetical protein
MNVLGIDTDTSGNSLCFRTCLLDIDNKGKTIASVQTHTGGSYLYRKRCGEIADSVIEVISKNNPITIIICEKMDKRFPEIQEIMGVVMYWLVKKAPSIGVLYVPSRRIRRYIVTDIGGSTEVCINKAKLEYGVDLSEDNYYAFWAAIIAKDFHIAPTHPMRRCIVDQMKTHTELLLKRVLAKGGSKLDLSKYKKTDFTKILKK